MRASAEEALFAKKKRYFTAFCISQWIFASYLQMNCQNEPMVQNAKDGKFVLCEGILSEITLCDRPVFHLAARGRRQGAVLYHSRCGGG